MQGDIIAYTAHVTFKCFVHTQGDIAYTAHVTFKCFVHMQGGIAYIAHVTFKFTDCS